MFCGDWNLSVFESEEYYITFLRLLILARNRTTENAHDNFIYFQKNNK